MMLFFISRNFGKLVKNLKEYKTKLYFTYQSFCHQNRQRNFDRVSEPIKFKRYRDIFWTLFAKNRDFRQTVRTVKCPFGKMSVRQNVRSAKRPSAKCPFSKMSFGKMFFGKVSFSKLSGHRFFLLLYFCCFFINYEILEDIFCTVIDDSSYRTKSISTARKSMFKLVKV